MEATKERLRDPAQRRRFMLTAINSASALPLSHALAAMRMSPNAVSILSLLVSIVGLAAVASGEGLRVVAGTLLVHLGLLLDHSDGQVARLRGMGSDWGMYLDMVIDRVVETGLIVATVAAALSSAQGWPVLPAWGPMSSISIAITAVLTLGAMLTWRFLNAYNDVLYLRSHLRAKATVPMGAGAAPGRGPVFNRDWVFLIWVVGTLLGQHQAVLVLLLLLHLLATAGKVRAFRMHHAAPEARAAAILGDDYH